MNLHGIVSGAIGAVNPHLPAQVRVHTGNVTTLPNGDRVPEYAAPVSVTIQKQELSQADLQLVDGLNIQGVKTVAYLNGAWYGTVRRDRRGGDLFIINDVTWKVIAVPELWPDWAKVILCQQL